MEVTSWNLHQGNYLVELTPWTNLHHGSSLMELKSWKSPSGTYTMEVTSWNLHQGNYLVELTAWTLPYVTYIIEVT